MLKIGAEMLYLRSQLSSTRFWSGVAAVLFTGAIFWGQAPVAINLAATTSPTAAQPGVTTLTLTCSALPAGTITAANLRVTLQVATGNTGPNLTATVSAFSALPGGAGRITFQVNGTNVTAVTPYQVSVSGTTSTGTAFASSKPASITINPGAAISLNPNTGLAGQSPSVTITGQYTNFVQGSTTANFGAGITVSTLTVTSPTTATAQITITVNAAPGPRTVTVSTGVQQASLNNGFTVGGAPAITLLNPNSGQQGQQGLPVTITAQFTHFVQGTTTANFGTGVTVVSLTINSLTSALAVVNIDSAATVSSRTVTLTTGMEIASLLNGFSVTTTGTPAISQVSPNTGLQGQANLPVTITGQFTHFAMTTSQVSFGAGITVNNIFVTNTTTLIANINVAGNATVGGRTVTVTTGSEVVSLTNGFTVQQGPPLITLTSPINLSFLNISPTTVNGTVSDPAASVVVNSIAAPVSNGGFSIQLPLAEGPNLITATATSASGLVNTATIQVTLDTTPPHVTITSPTDQFVTTTASISVSGSVNDIVVGTVNAQQAQVSVNGTAATVANRTFLANNIPLNLGPNVIQATAHDQAGNAATTQITVTRQAPTQQPQIQLISGNSQTGVIGTLLTAPLVVSLTDAGGNPVPNKPVIFKITQNNGMVAAGGAPASSVVSNTNAQGQAQAQWTLGKRAGAGSDNLQAYAVGFNGTAIFTASSTLGPAGNIVIDSGNNQIGPINQALPKPLIAVVVDSGDNRLPNVPVTFTVQQGGGSFGGQTSVTLTTDSDGRVGATLTLGYQEGNSNNLVEANFPGNQGFPASFMASGRAEGPVANTVISGVVLDNSNQPIPGVTIRAVLTNVINANPNVNAVATVQANAQGQFSIPQAPVGFVKLLVDGSTAQKPGTYPTLDYDMVTIAGQNNTLGMPVYLLPLTAVNQLCVTATTGGGTLTMPEAPGFSLTFGPGQVTFPGGSQTGCVSVTVVHPDKVPMPPGFGQQPRFIVTIQPAGALFNPPAPITLPNVDGLAPRAVTEMYSFDHDIGSFVAIGTGVVSDDGQVIRSSQGVGVLKAGWHCGGNTTSGGTAATCPVCSFCSGSQCQPQGNGTACGNGGTCQYQQGCVCPPGQVFDPTTQSCVSNTPCLPGYALMNGQCCQGNTCGQPMCLPGLVFDPTTGTCVNNSPCQPGFTLVGGQCCQGNTCTPPSCPPGQTFNPVTGACVNSGPCPPGYTLNNGQCCQGGTCTPPTCPPGQIFDPITGTCVNGPCPPGCSACVTIGGTQQCTQCSNGQPPVNGNCNMCNISSVTATVEGAQTTIQPIGRSLNFAVTSVNAGCQNLTYAWDFGDGSTSNLQTPQHFYSTANVFLVSVVVSCPNCNSTQASAAVTIVQPSISLMWSDQLANGIVGNYYPPAIGEGTTPGYVLMGARADGLGHVLTTVQISPTTPDVLSSVLVRFRDHNNPTVTSVGTATVLSTTPSSATVSVLTPALGTFVTTYDVIVGIDFNNDGQIDVTEQLATSANPVVIVPLLAYVGSLSTLQIDAGICQLGGLIPGIVLPPQFSCTTASNFLISFVTGTIPNGTLPGSMLVTEAQFAGQKLHHRVGVSFAADGTPQFPQYVFPATGSVAAEIRASTALLNTLGSTLASYAPTVYSYFRANPNASLNTFTGVPLNATSIQFVANDPDLAIAFGGAGLTNVSFNFTVQREQPSGDLVVTTLSIVSGDLIDIYNWNYADGSLASLAAEVQAGYPTLGTGGQVFGEDVQLQGELPQPLIGVIWDFGPVP